MNALLHGYRRFHGEVQPAQRELFGKLASDQSPETLFITCSDSSTRLGS